MVKNTGLKKTLNAKQFREAVAGVVRRHMRGVDPDAINDSAVAQIAASAVAEVMNAMRSSTNPVGHLAKQSTDMLEHVEFERFRDLSLCVPQSGGAQVASYTLLSDGFFDEPFFKEHATIAAVRKYFEVNHLTIDDLPGNHRDSGRMRYDRRQDLARLVYMCGLEPLPGMMELPPAGNTKVNEAWDKEHLIDFMESTMSPQAREGIRRSLRQVTADEKYLLTNHNTTRWEILTLLKIERNSLGALDNVSNFGLQARAQVMLLLFPQRIIIQDDALHVVTPRSANNRFRRQVKLGRGVKQYRKAGL